MKDFQEFISTLTPETYENIKKEIFEDREPASLTDSIPEISFKMSLKLLEMYHDWLND